MQEVHPKSILEAALLTAQRPLALRELHDLVGEGTPKDELKALLMALAAEWQVRGSLQLAETAVGWRFATHVNVRAHLEPLHAERPQRYSRAVMETLAVIAYRQPVTRGDIEDIRGVAVGSQIIKQLEDRGWIDCIGHRDAPGRPALYATTKQFLDDLALNSIAELPPLDGAPTVVPTQAMLPIEGEVGQIQLDLSPDSESEPAPAGDIEPRQDISASVLPLEDLTLESPAIAGTATASTEVPGGDLLSAPVSPDPLPSGS